jgi:hypothetical protein
MFKKSPSVCTVIACAGRRGKKVAGIRAKIVKKLVGPFTLDMCSIDL